MSNIAIRAENVGKRYRLGSVAERHDNLREALVHAAKAPFRNLNRLRRLSSFKDEEEQDVVWALRDVSFEVKHGEVLGIIGSNGAGKSTLLKVLSRITEPTTGRVRVHGRVGALLEVGTGFHPELTGRENVYLNGSILGMDRAYIERQFEQIVEFAGVGKFIDTPVKRYSSGMYLRLAFSVAAHLEPEILIVDEVLAVGDAEFQKKCLGRMGEVAREGRTVLFVSHNMGAVRSLCTEAFWLRNGHNLVSGASSEIVDTYLRNSLEAQGNSLEVGHMQRNSGVGERFRLVHIELNGGRPIMHGEPLRIAFEFEVRGAAEGVSLGLGLSTLDGTRLVTIESDLLGERQGFPFECRGRAEAVISQLHLQPGQYMLDAAVRSGDSVILDYVNGFAQVEVLPGPTTPGMMIAKGTGGVRIPANWTWPSVARC